MPPDRSEWGTVWLGADTISDENDGWYPVIGDVKVAQLAVFERKITVGDATKDSEDFISSWIMGDLTGGGQIETINEGSDSNRYWWSENLDTRSPNAIMMPPPLSELTQSGVSSAATSYPLGDVFASDNTPTRMAVAFGTSVRLHDNSSSTFSSAASTSLGAEPVSKGFAWQGPQAFPRLYVPLGTYGYATVIDNGSGVPTVTNVAASGTPDPRSLSASLKPKAQAFAEWNNNLYCLDTRGYLWMTTDGIVWNGVADNAKKAMRLDESRIPRTMITYVNKAGDPTLHIISDRDVWQYDSSPNNRLVLTSLQFPPHPEFGKSATVWRPGEDLWITAGQDLVKYTAASVIVPFSGLARDDGLPASISGPITDICAEASTLFAVTSSKTVTSNNVVIQIHVWTGTGWHSMWTKTVRECKPRMALSVANGKYRLWIGSRAASTTGSILYVNLEPNMYNPRTQRSDFFTGTYQSGNGKLITGIFDAAMSGFRKLASHVTLQMSHASSTQYVDVYLETEDDRAAGTNVYVGRVNADGRTVLPLKRSGTFDAGIAFNDVRLELRFVNGTPPAGAANTLAMESVALHYTKIPQNTASYAFTVPLPKEGWHGRGPGELSSGLYGMLTAETFLKFVHNGKVERVRVAGISGAGATGEDLSGALQVSLIAVRAT